MGNSISPSLKKDCKDLRLDEECKKCCTISTYKGVFKYNRLCFGISSAPRIFLRVIEETFQDIPGVASFLDIIIT